VWASVVGGAAGGDVVAGGDPEPPEGLVGAGVVPPPGRAAGSEVDDGAGDEVDGVEDVEVLVELELELVDDALLEDDDELLEDDELPLVLDGAVGAAGGFFTDCDPSVCTAAATMPAMRRPMATTSSPALKRARRAGGSGTSPR
jgi:hypothetical protein